MKDIAHMIGIYNQKPGEAYFCIYVRIYRWMSQVAGWCTYVVKNPRHESSWLAAGRRFFIYKYQKVHKIIKKMYSFEEKNHKIIIFLKK